MRKVLFLFICVISNVYSQKNIKTESLLYNLQLGSGIWCHLEKNIGHKNVLKSELGLNIGYSFSSDKGANFDFVPQIGAELRRYYNLDQRRKKEKSYAYNSANFLGFESRLFVFKPLRNDEVILDKQIQFLMNWGIRRVNLKKWNYEIGFGLGLANHFETNIRDFVAKIHLRFGKTLKKSHQLN